LKKGCHVGRSWKNSRALGATKAVAIVEADKRVVAIVEDDASMLKGLARLLGAHGFATEVYTSAEAFLAGAAASEAGCLVLDINLGGISGIELRHRLAAAGSRLPVILMTAIDSDAVQKAAAQAACIAYLRKPFSSRQLIDAIGQVVS
jgi:FixJ family two-component response regulator